MPWYLEEKGKGRRRDKFSKKGKEGGEKNRMALARSRVGQTVIRPPPYTHAYTYTYMHICAHSHVL